MSDRPSDLSEYAASLVTAEGTDAEHAHARALGAAYLAGRAAGEQGRARLEAALRAIADIVKRHTHQGAWAMTRLAGNHPEQDCHLCRALVAAGVLTLDEIGAGTRAALGEQGSAE